MMSVQLAKAVLRTSSLTPFAGVGGYAPTSEQASAADRATRFRQAEVERADAETFFQLFTVPVDIAGKRVLDFGCGYGGKTVAFAELAEFVCGVEPIERHIEMAREYAGDMPNVEFRLCSELEIPYPDASFDAVLSHDVLEHVASPAASMKEIWRVLRPGGQAYLRFPPYDGHSSHHLDYVSRLPGLHWIFAPTTLVEATNAILCGTGGERFNTARQPPPHRSWCGSRMVLPTLNGLTGQQFEALARQWFEIVHLDYQLAGHRRTSVGRALAYNVLSRPAKALGLGEYLTTGITAVLAKTK